MEQIEIQYDLSEETLIKAYREMMIHGNAQINPLILIGIWVFTLLVVQFMNPGISISGTIYAVLSLSAILAFIYFFKVYHPNAWVKRSVKELRLPKPVQIIIRSNSIDLRTPIVQSTSKWEVFRKLLFTQDVIIGYFAQKQTLAIPTSAFTPEQLAQFKTWAKANVKEVIV